MAKGAFKRRLRWVPGDVFVVPLSDGSFAHAQAVAPVASHAIDFVLFNTRVPPNSALIGPAADCIAISVHATWRTVVTGGHWGFIGHHPLLVSPEACPNQRLIAAGGVQVKHSSWGLVESFLSAYHGLLPWNMYPAFDFDSYLLPGVDRPIAAKVLTPDQLALMRSREAGSSYAA